MWPGSSRRTRDTKPIDINNSNDVHSSEQASLNPQSALEESYKKPVRIHYLDNLRTLAMFGVVTGHCCVFSIVDHDFGPWIGFQLRPDYMNVKGQYDNISWPSSLKYMEVSWTAFVALNLPAIMPIFFFVSGYLTPSSLKKKGAYAFLRGRFFSLAVPLFVVYFCLNDLWSRQLTLRLAFGLDESDTSARMTKEYAYMPFAILHLWFVSHLLVYYILYVLFDTLGYFAP